MIIQSIFTNPDTKKIHDVIKYNTEVEIMNRILIVEDERSIAEMTKLCLTKNGYICDYVTNGSKAADRIENKHYDLILLDVMLPDMDGFELMEYINQFNIPVIFVTAKIAISDRVKGLKSGAEDYITKPFDLQELLARIENVLRRYNKTERVLTVGDIKIDTMSRNVIKGKEEITLTAKEYDLLLYFVRNKNIALYRETMYEQVWQEPYFGNTRTIDLHVQRLKKKLKLGDAIETVYKVGYRFSPEKIK